MPEVSKKLILELKKIIKEEYGREVTYGEAREIANGMVGYYSTLIKIHNREQNERGHH